MKDCILSIFWPRNDIYSFFKDHDCTSGDLRVIEDFKDRDYHGAQWSINCLTNLPHAADGGLGPFRSMLQLLNDWTRFDPYYFDKLRKLDRTAAERNIAHLRQLNGDP